MRRPETFGHHEFFRVRSKLAKQTAYGRQAFAHLNISNLPALWIAERTFGLGTLRVGSGIGMGGKAMQSGSVKVVLTLGALISCIGAICAFRVVAD
nr:hypothetical protein [Tanacetum cinerariifolium]